MAETSAAKLTPAYSHEKAARLAGKQMKKLAKLEDQFAEQLPGVDLQPIFEDAKQRLTAMLESIDDIPKGARMHTDNFIFPQGALYLAMKDVCGDAALPAMEQVKKNEALKKGASLGKACSKRPVRLLFFKSWTPLTKKLFGETAGFANTFYDAPKGHFRMDITKCPYHDYFQEIGAFEIASFFCDADEYAYGDLPGVTFERTETLNKGGTRCDFHMYLDEYKDADVTESAEVVEVADGSEVAEGSAAQD